MALDDVARNTVLEDRLQEVYTAGNRAKDLVKQILTFSRQTEQECKPVIDSPQVMKEPSFSCSTFS
jgi:hypothetical protein